MRIGVVSTPLERGKEIARDLGLDDAVVLSARTKGAGRGIHFDALIIDGSVPISDARLGELSWCLKGGPMSDKLYRITRYE